ncbi:hypothetical protein [Photobacterium lipolyticum]|uniref:Uncharacterized protein n=1 Tax=Photobacterium lipolyticum TaxID=266810 RepID=A0A2T3MUC9_9GAMM|nr:hypothetical protein [Photobacterium lipolyticum]PSW03548.1 hypothetical protein C9I89_17750 [Photobacterium lipolyticum]
MSNSQLKRVNYSIYLDPVNSNSDRYAVGVMQNWAKERREMMSDPSAGVALHYSLHMHKNIYLSGMFLYLLSPAMSNGLAGSLSEDNIKMETLKQQLENCGLALPSSESASPAIDMHALISEMKAAVDMQPLLSEIQQLKAELADLKATEPAVPAVDTEALVGELRAESDISPLIAEIQQLKKELLESKDVAAESQNALSESDLATLQHNLSAEMKAHSQHREIAELKALLKAQNKLIKALSNGQPLPEIEDPEPEMNLSQQIASIQKVKKKGIF